MSIRNLSSARGKAFTASLGRFYRDADSEQNRVFARMKPFEQANVELITEIGEDQ